MDTGLYMYLYVGSALSDQLCQQLFNTQNFAQIDEDAVSLSLRQTFFNRMAESQNTVLYFRSLIEIQEFWVINVFFSQV